MEMLLDQQMLISSLTKWEHTQYDRCKSYPIICKWLHTGHPKEPSALKRCTNAALTLHTGVLSKTFAIKSSRNPARHIFPWLPGEAVGLHTGVLTKPFAMSVLYLKTIDVFFKRKSFNKSVH